MFERLYHLDRNLEHDGSVSEGERKQLALVQILLSKQFVDRFIDLRLLKRDGLAWLSRQGIVDKDHINGAIG